MGQRRTLSRPPDRDASATSQLPSPIRCRFRVFAFASLKSPTVTPNTALSSSFASSSVVARARRRRAISETSETSDGRQRTCRIHRRRTDDAERAATGFVAPSARRHHCHAEEIARPRAWLSARVFE